MTLGEFKQQTIHLPDTMELQFQVAGVAVPIVSVEEIHDLGYDNYLLLR